MLPTPKTARMRLERPWKIAFCLLATFCAGYFIAQTIRSGAGGGFGGLGRIRCGNAVRALALDGRTELYRPKLASMLLFESALASGCAAACCLWQGQALPPPLADLTAAMASVVLKEES